MGKILFTLLTLLVPSPAEAIDVACTQTTNLSIYRCPQDSTDWYDSYTGIVDNLDALARTAPSSFTVLGQTLMNNRLTLSNSSITLTGTLGFISSQSSITANSFFGDGSNLTGVGGTGHTISTGVQNGPWSDFTSRTNLNFDSGYFVAVDSSAGNGTHVSLSSQTAYRELQYDAVSLLSSTHPVTFAPTILTTINGNSVYSAAFNPDEDNCRLARLMAPEIDTSAGSLAEFHIVWFSTSVTSGNVVWIASHSQTGTAGESWNQTLESVSFSATAVQGTAHQMSRSFVTETVSNLGWAKDDFISLYICRDADAAGDTMAGTAHMLFFRVKIPRRPP